MYKFLLGYLIGSAEARGESLFPSPRALASFFAIVMVVLSIVWLVFGDSYPSFVNCSEALTPFSATACLALAVRSLSSGQSQRSNQC